MKVRSSMIKEVEWEELLRTPGVGYLYVLFNTDEAYKYKNVPKGIYNKLIIAHKGGNSVGGFFDTYVKKAGYEYEKIDWETRKVVKKMELYKKTCFELINKGLARVESDENGDERIVLTGDLNEHIFASALDSSIINKMHEELNFKEEWPGQKQEYLQQKAIEQAVSAADRIILDASDGSVEETNYLTSQIALKFAEKVNMAVTHELRKKELMSRVK